MTKETSQLRVIQGNENISNPIKCKCGHTFCPCKKFTPHSQKSNSSAMEQRAISDTKNSKMVKCRHCEKKYPSVVETDYTDYCSDCEDKQVWKLLI